MMTPQASAVEIGLRHIIGRLRGAALGVTIDATYAVDQQLAGVFVTQLGGTRPQRAIGGGRVAESVSFRVLCSADGREYGAIKTLVERVRQVLDESSDGAIGVYECELRSEISDAVPIRDGVVDARVALVFEVIVAAVP